MSILSLERDYPLLTALAESHIEWQKTPPNTQEIAQRFYDTLADSGLYTWIGIVAGTDETGLQAVDVYLLRDSQKLPQEAEADIVDLFDDLSLALEPQLNARLHLINSADIDREKLKLRLRENPGSSRSLVWEEDLPANK